MAQSDRPSLGELIRRQRELNELSLRQLARIVGISNPYLSQIERGLREPSDSVLEGIARSLKLPIDDLYARAGAAADGEADEEEPAVIGAIREDARLSARQRQALIEVYEAFVAAGPRQRRGRRRTEGG